MLTGLFGTGGPPLIIYYHLAGLSKSAFRGNLMAIFLLQTCLRVPAYAVGGLLTAPRLWSGLMLMPAALLGTWAGPAAARAALRDRPSGGWSACCWESSACCCC